MEKILAVIGAALAAIALAIKGLEYLFGTIEQMTKKIYQWVSNILNNLKSVLKKMGIMWSIKTENFPQSRFEKWKEKIFGKEGKFTKHSESTSKTMMRNEDLKMEYVFLLIELISELYKSMSDVEGIPLSKSEGSSGEQGGRSDGGEFDVVNASWETPAETPAEEDSVMTKLNAISNQITEMNSSLQVKGEKAPAEDNLTEIKEALMRIEGALGLSDIAAALEEIRAGLQSLIRPEGEEGTAAGENPAITEAKPADNEVKLTEQTNDLGVEVRDSKRSLKFDIDEVKAKLDRLIKVIEKKAMTFNDIYDQLCIRMIREHRNATGRILR